MTDVERYLDRIGVERPPVPGAVALARTTLRGERTEEAVPDAASWAAALRTHFGIARAATGDGK